LRAPPTARASVRGLIENGGRDERRRRARAPPAAVAPM